MTVHVLVTLKPIMHVKSVDFKKLDGGQERCEIIKFHSRGSEVAMLATMYMCIWCETSSSRQRVATYP